MCEARNFTVCVDEIYGVRREICSAGLEGVFRATRRRSKICSVKYDAEFCSAACRDKISGAMADDKIFDVVSADAGNFEIQNARVNLRSRNTYADLKFKGDANSKPAGDANFKFKNGASFGFLCRGNVRSLKSMSWANALSFSAAMEISALVKASEILKYGVTAGILALALASKILISSIAGKILNLSATPSTGGDFGLKGASGC
ncbi:MAG: hypothetical protein KH703_08450 [Campylobacter gracilis]|uniref:hypothetical protein n=1 Tax=Campylobacter gracilis TaxID=824 RepID=UPI0026EE8704|nr:hypothetical protein [Campylobacter gracilis]MBS6153401.1 hypothetical protein [Campylobacter gracilis]